MLPLALLLLSTKVTGALLRAATLSSMPCISIHPSPVKTVMRGRTPVSAAPIPAAMAQPVGAVWAAVTSPSGSLVVQ